MKEIKIFLASSKIGNYFVTYISPEACKFK